MRHLFYTLIIFIVFQNQQANAFNFDYRKQFFAIGASHGGEKLAETANKKLTTGGGLAVHYGINMTGSQSIHYQLALGYKWDSLSTSNGSATFSDLSTSFIMLKKIRKNRFGGGLALHPATKYESKFQGNSFTSDMPAAIGLIAQFDIITKHKSTLSFQYELLEYKPDNLIKSSTGQKIETLDASNIAFVFRYHFQ